MLFYSLLGGLAFSSCSTNNAKQELSESAYNVDSIALTPPLGWNSYNCFGGNATEQDIKVNADYMAENLAQYGWEYVVLDFLWYCDDQSTNEKYLNRRPEQHIDEYGRAIPSVLLHPSSAEGKGLKPLGDYIHSKGLKFGLHIMRGMPFQAVKENTPIMGTEYFAFLNTNEKPYSVKYDLGKFVGNKSFEVKDLWSQERINPNNGLVELTVPVHGAIIISVK